MQSGIGLLVLAASANAVCKVRGSSVAKCEARPTAANILMNAVEQPDPGI